MKALGAEVACIYNCTLLEIWLSFFADNYRHMLQLHAATTIYVGNNNSNSVENY